MVLGYSWLLTDTDSGFCRSCDFNQDDVANNSDIDTMADYFATDGGAGISSKQYYYHFDQLGSVIALTDDAGSVVETYKYDVFGMPQILDNTSAVVVVSTVGNPYMFTARRYDPETTLYYYRARMYNPTIGRFLQTDPIGYADGLNWYAYCGNNPIILIDPYGLYGGNDRGSRGTDWENMDFFEKFGEGYYYGTGLAEESANYWAEQYIDSSGWDKFEAGLGLAASSLWQPESFETTLLVIIVAGTIDSASQRLVTDGPNGTRVFQVRNAETGEPYFRLDKGPVPGKGPKTHYHRWPDMSKHRPDEGF